MEHLRMESMDMTKENVQKIAALFPNCVTEHKDANGNIVLGIDFEKLKIELGDDIIGENDERYQFTWPDKKQAIREANTATTSTLRPCREESVDFDNTQNLYIEGDNLEVLKCLRETYLGKVKMIYIDPPYNTGNDFVYDDDFSIENNEYKEHSGQKDEEGKRLFKNTESNGRFHTDWLNMMYPRIKVAKDLLIDGGLIFISIDDCEVVNLRKVCDEIFGQDNIINTICINMNSLSGVKMTHVAKGKRFPAQKEYLLIYKKGNIQPILSIEKKPKGKWDKEYNMIIPELIEGQYESFQEIDDKELNKILSEMHLISLVDYAKENGIELNDEWKFSNSYRIFGTKSNRSLAKKIILQSYDQQIYGYTNSDGNKRFFRTDYNKETKDPRIELVQAKSTLEVYISDNWVDISNDGGVAQEGNVIYPNGKKPLQLVNRIIRTTNSKDGIFLDFFSGSATTAHSVMLQNLFDCGQRNFIMVQIPENLNNTIQKTNGDDRDDIQSLIDFCDSINKPRNICELGKERIRRAGNKIKKELEQTIASLESRINLLDARPSSAVQLLPLEDQKEIAKKIYEEQVAPLLKEKSELEYRLASLDIGFRVLKLDSSNMEDVYYTPFETNDNLFSSMNIKADRNDLDLLFQVMLESNVELSEKIETKTIEGKKVYFVKGNYLVACFDEEVNEKVITAIAKEKPYYFVLRDSSLASDNVADNFEQIFRSYSPDTIRKIL